MHVTNKNQKTVHIFVYSLPFFLFAYNTHKYMQAKSLAHITHTLACMYARYAHKPCTHAHTHTQHTAHTAAAPPAAAIAEENKISYTLPLLSIHF